MSVKCVFYCENGEQCVVDYDDPIRHKQKLPPGARMDFPDEVHFISTAVMTVIKRDKSLDEIRAAGLMKKYGHKFRLYANDIPLSDAIPKESK